MGEQPLDVRKCKNCDRIIRGRSDKKFCDDACRNFFNNKWKSTNNNVMRRINNALGKNRRLLEELMNGGNEAIRVRKDTLEQLGFKFQYHTHTLTTRAGKTYFYCYDVGYLPLGEELLLVVRKRNNDKQLPMPKEAAFI